MQTFLPLPSFAESLSVLDRRRLGMQRVEAYQILLTLCRERSGWSNHPAVRMWRGHEGALVRYFKQAVLMWTAHGYRDSTWQKWTSTFRTFPIDSWRDPPWVGDERLHSSHRSNLLRKDPKFYRAYGWNEPDNIPYFWPI